LQPPTQNQPVEDSSANLLKKKKAKDPSKYAAKANQAK
jgi:hypothetical protein